MKFCDYPDVKIHFSDLEGNPVDVVDRVARCLREAGVAEIKIQAFTMKAMDGDKDHSLRIVYKTVEIE